MDGHEVKVNPLVVTYRISQAPTGKYVIGMRGGANDVWYAVGHCSFDSWHEAERGLQRVVDPETRLYDAKGNRIE